MCDFIWGKPIFLATKLQLNNSSKAENENVGYLFTLGCGVVCPLSGSFKKRKKKRKEKSVLFNLLFAWILFQKANSHRYFIYFCVSSMPKGRRVMPCLN